MKPHTGKLFNCLNCNSEFYVPINRFNTAKYCSRKCSALYNRKTITANCAICNNEFTHTSSRCNSAKYCSRKCYYKSMKNKGSVSKNCKHCGILFQSSPSQNRIYCSRLCINKENKKIFKPKFSTVRKQMEARGLIESCNRCGYSDFKQILGVHHKDRNRNNNDLSNLEVLCPNCHSLEHMKHINHGFKE